MGSAARPRPERLAEKLLSIRQARGLSQAELIRELNFKPLVLIPAIISTYERGKREPCLPLLLSYSKLAGISVDLLIDDELDLPQGQP